MAKAAFWKTDWFLGGVLTLLVALASAFHLFQGLERSAYDAAFRMSSRTPSERIAIIAIDEPSIDALGAWPWSPDLFARITDLLSAAQAKLIVDTAGFQTSPSGAGYQSLRRLVVAIALASAEGEPVIGKIRAAQAEAELALGGEQRLGEHYGTAGRVLLPLLSDSASARGSREKASPDFLARFHLGAAGNSTGLAWPIDTAVVPGEALTGRAAGVGYLGWHPDGDRVIRREPLIVSWGGRLFPSLALLSAARSQDIAIGNVELLPGRELRVGKLRIPVVEGGQINPFFYRSGSFAVHSFKDVLSGRIPASQFAGKIVLVGVTANDIGSRLLVPTAPPDWSPVLMLANSLSSILQGDSIVVPAWGRWVELAAILLLGIYVSLLLPQLRMAAALLSAAGILILLVVIQFGLMLGIGYALSFVGAALLLLLGLVLRVARLHLEGADHGTGAVHSSAESNRLRGLALQGQGLLDQAFKQFCQCPINPELMDNLYALGLDYERQREFAKAETVFRHMAGFDPTFRDLAQRLSRTSAGPATLAEQTAPAPRKMLGRYLLERELGKGSMGVVYQGRDPKINRVVAIKTVDLAQEFEADEVAEVKQRFFREAETAGRLNHPNIVAIYDAGEEHDLAYIAMEFLNGQDLLARTKPGGLLPLTSVLSIVARIAGALDYAHQNQVVHRDIKPANIMYEPNADQVKVTDFGIARITDSSRTRAGMVLGTPSYMSPEQLAGKKIDGRSDLFSLSVMLYQLSCGQLPFVGESLAQLMFKIANEPPTDILTVKPDLPPCLLKVIDKGLNKNIAQRFQRGSEMAAAVRACLNILETGESA